MSLNWDVPKTYQLLRDLLNEFNQNDQMFGDLVRRRINEPLGIDLEKDIIETIDGRLTYVSWVEMPPRINSNTNLVGIKFKDIDHFQKVLEKQIEKNEGGINKRAFGTDTYYEIETPRRRNREVPANIRQPRPCLAIVGDYFVISDSTGLLEHVISTKNNAKLTLANELEYKLVASRIARQSGQSRPSMICFNRPEKGMRLLYDLAVSDQTRSLLEDGSQDNPALRALSEALKDQPLPAFEELAKYLAPAGGMLTSDEAGLHYMTFGLKRN
jgi:hypothetical protein